MQRCLKKSGAVRDEKVAAELHRLRFARVRAARPGELMAAFGDAGRHSVG